MHLEKEHSFEEAEAVARLRALTDYWAARYNVQTNWHANQATISGKVKGIKFDAKISVSAQKLSGEVKVGFLAEKLGGKGYVEHKLEEYFNPSVSIEELQKKAA